MKRSAEPLGLHGIVLRSRDPERLARRCRELFGLPVLRRTKREVILAEGPELFVAIRRGAPGARDRVEEIHLAVKNVAATRRAAAPDALGGDSWTRTLAEALRLTVREFRRPPQGRWRKSRS